METIVSFFQEAGFWGSIGIIATFSVFVAILYGSVNRTRIFPEDVHEVTYSFGHPEFKESKNGRLLVANGQLVFQSFKGDEYFRLPVSSIKSVEHKHHDPGPLALAFGGPIYGVAASRLQYLFIRATDARGQELKLQFSSRTRANRMGKLKNLILEAVSGA